MTTLKKSPFDELLDTIRNEISEEASSNVEHIPREPEVGYDHDGYTLSDFTAKIEVPLEFVDALKDEGSICGKVQHESRTIEFVASLNRISVSDACGVIAVYDVEAD